MANQNLFRNSRSRSAAAVNEAGGRAYARTPEQALAQLAVTGCFNDTFYASADAHLEATRKLAFDVAPGFLAKVALYARQRGQMKDMPAFACAVLAARDIQLLEKVFPRVIDDGKMLRNFVQVVRSGVTGRRSLGTAPKRIIQTWFEAQSPEQLFRYSVGNDPSLADVIKLARPRPSSATRRALYGYLIGKAAFEAVLPELVQAFEAYKRGDRAEVPKVPFQMLTALDLGKREWTAIAERASWQMTRMNLNTFLRHGVFEDRAVTKTVAERLRDRKLIRSARAFPYQLLTAYQAAAAGVPKVIRDALHDAMEIAIENVPSFDARVVVCPDVSGSMGSPVTGFRRGSTTSTRCVDVAALVASAVLRRNAGARVMPFDTAVRSVRMSAADTVMANAQRLSSLWGGGTSVSAPLAALNREKHEGDLVIFVSDNQSWFDAGPHGATATMTEWDRYRRRNPGAKLVCIDIQPYRTTQTETRADVLNVGGFSDAVFDVISAFVRSSGEDHFVKTIEAVEV